MIIMPFKKRAQLSIELIVLIFAVLLGGALLTSNMLSDSGEYNEISNVKKSTFSAFINSEGTVTSESGNNENTEEEGNEDESEEEEEDTGEDESLKYTRIYINAPVNPTGSEKNNKFSAVLEDGRVIELKKKGSDKGLYIGGEDYPIIRGNTVEFNITKLIIRIKQPSQTTLLVNETPVDKNSKKFTVEVKEISPMLIKIRRDNGNNFNIELNATGVKINVDEDDDNDEDTYSSVNIYVDNLKITDIKDITGLDISGKKINNPKTDTWYDAKEIEFIGDSTPLDYHFSHFLLRTSNLSETIYSKVPVEMANKQIKIVSNIPQGIRFLVSGSKNSGYKITIHYDAGAGTTGYGATTNNVDITFQ
jgi:hypothetical protein